MPACPRLPPHSRGPGVLARWHTARQPRRLADLVTLVVRRVVGAPVSEPRRPLSYGKNDSFERARTAAGQFRVAAPVVSGPRALPPHPWLLVLPRRFLLVQQDSVLGRTIRLNARALLPGSLEWLLRLCLAQERFRPTLGFSSFRDGSCWCSKCLRKGHARVPGIMSRTSTLAPPLTNPGALVAELSASLARIPPVEGSGAWAQGYAIVATLPPWRDPGRFRWWG